MSNFAVIKLADEVVQGKWDVTPEMINNAPAFDTEEEASHYIDLINPDALWVIMPLDDNMEGRHEQW